MGYDAIFSNAPTGTKIPSADFNELLALLRPRISVVPSEGDNDSPFLFSAATPGAADRGKLWFRKTNDTSAGILVGAYFYVNGKWCKAYTSAPGTMVLWQGGDPTAFFHPITGKGLFSSSTPEVANDWYGWMMLLESGSGLGFPGNFLMAANKWDSASSTFQGKLPGSTTYAATGGDPTGTTLTPENIPTLDVAITEQNYPLDNGNEHTGIYRNIIQDKYNGAQTLPDGFGDKGKFTNPNDGEVATPVPYKAPPFKAAPLVVFVGYNYTDPSL